MKAVDEIGVVETASGEAPTEVTVPLVPVSTRAMLEGLSSSHALVIAIDSERRVAWMSDDLGLFCPGAKSRVGQSVDRLIDEIAVHDKDEFRSRASAFGAELQETGHVESARFDLGQSPSVASVEVTAFRVEAENGEPLSVCMARRLGPGAPIFSESAPVDPNSRARHLTSESLERKNEELENCVCNVAHDLRSPLASLLGFTRLLRDDYEAELDSTGRKFLDRIEEAGHHMEALLQGMLEVSRIGAARLRKTRMNPRTQLLQLRSELKFRLEENRIELSIPENPPTLVADSTQLYQLFSNLIGNAVSHREPVAEGDPPGRIDVEIAEAQDGWLITVSDDGPGIAPEDQKRVFEMFQTVGVRRPGKKHSGLGLAIVQKVVESHAGKIWLESAVGKGARFIVHLPDAESGSEFTGQAH